MYQYENHQSGVLAKHSANNVDPGEKAKKGKEIPIGGTQDVDFQKTYISPEKECLPVMHLLRFVIELPESRGMKTFFESWPGLVRPLPSLYGILGSKGQRCFCAFAIITKENNNEK